MRYIKIKFTAPISISDVVQILGLFSPVYRSSVERLHLLYGLIQFCIGFHVVNRVSIMTERWYRMIQGIYLLMALYLEHDMMVYGFMALLTIEAVTNLRLPVVISQLRYGTHAIQTNSSTTNCTFNIDSERLLRLVVVLFLLLSYVLYSDPTWFLPWFVAAMLLLAGITNICPMVMMFQYLGFR